MESGSILWFITVAIGPLALALAVGYALMRRRRLSRREKLRQDEATHEIYHNSE